MRSTKINRFILLFSFLLLTSWCYSVNSNSSGEYSNIQVKEKRVQGVPKGSSIQASIDGNTLTIVFTENLGQVAIEITTASGTHMDFMSLPTPNGFQFFIMTPGDYIVNFTLPNGDEYYGEFTVTD